MYDEQWRMLLHFVEIGAGGTRAGIIFAAIGAGTWRRPALGLPRAIKTSSGVNTNTVRHIGTSELRRPT